MRYKAMFIVNNTSQAEMFKPITMMLHDWDNVAINTDRLDNKEQIENMLKCLNFNHKTVSGLNLKAVNDVIVKEHPDIVVVGNDTLNHMGRLFIKCANSMHIPTMLVQDGSMTRSRDKT